MTLTSVERWMGYVLPSVYVAEPQPATWIDDQPRLPKGLDPEERRPIPIYAWILTYGEAETLHEDLIADILNLNRIHADYTIPSFSYLRFSFR